MTKITNLSFYRFFSLIETEATRTQLLALCQNLDLKGTILLGQEGINANLAGNKHAIEHFKEQILKHLPVLEGVHWKESESDFAPFQRLLVKIKKEIVTIGVPDANPLALKAPHLAAKELQKWFIENKDFLLVDTRNDYEYSLGSFTGAEQLNLENFREFPQYVEELRQRQNNRPMVLFCTGGIRCEKAAPLLLQAGFRDVYQLEDGILGYFAQCGGAHYQGECFVFDERIAVNPQLQVSGAGLCQSCQWPISAGSAECHHCGTKS